MKKLSYLGNKNPKNYYQLELNKIDNLSSNIKIKIVDDEGNETKYLSLNKESIKEIESFLIGINLLID